MSWWIASLTRSFCLSMISWRKTLGEDSDGFGLDESGGASGGRWTNRIEPEQLVTETE